MTHKGKKKVPAGYSPISGCTPPSNTKFKPGQSGNPSGRPNAGLTVKEWINQMSRWGQEKTQAIIDDKDAPNAKVLAARIWIHARENAGANFDRIMDQTIGKPSQAVDLTSGGEKLCIEVLYRNKPSANDSD